MGGWTLKRNTIQRTLVLDAVNRLKSHATADEIYEAVVQTHPRISRATVYRNLNFLAEEGSNRNLNQLADDAEIQKLAMPDGPDRFDHILQRHYHAKCSRCGRVFDVEMDYMEDIIRLVKDAHGFAIDGHNLVFTGVCPSCQQADAQNTPASVT